MTRLCENCRKKTHVTVKEVETEEVVKGKTIHYTRLTAICSHCGEEIYDGELHDKNLEKMTLAYKNVGIEIIYGDILQSKKDIIVQQVNCRGFMGAGLSGQIMKRYQNVKKEYQKYREKQIKLGLTDEGLLGHVNFVDTYDGTIIANVFGQVNIRKGPGDDTVYTKNEALYQGIRIVKERAAAFNLSVAIPTEIGCGLAGGDWSEIKPEIEKIFNDSQVDVTMYQYKP